MTIVSWQDWLDKHIPYYEAEKYKDRFLNDPPKVVLIVSPVDRAKTNIKKGIHWSNYDTCNNQVVDTGYANTPLFLERDTHGRWFWGFWNEHEALMAVIKLS